MFQQKKKKDVSLVSFPKKQVFKTKTKKNNTKQAQIGLLWASPK